MTVSIAIKYGKLKIYFFLITILNSNKATLFIINYKRLFIRFDLILPVWLLTGRSSLTKAPTAALLNQQLPWRLRFNSDS